MHIYLLIVRYTISYNWSVSIVSSKTLLFRSSSDSPLMFLGGSISASLRRASLCFPCSVHGSGLSFQRECLLTGFLSNWSIALFITSWNSLMNSIRSALWLTSDELSLSSWSLAWSGGDLFVTSHCFTFPVRLLDSPVTSRLLWISLIFHYICTLSDPISGVPLLRPAS